MQVRIRISNVSKTKHTKNHKYHVRIFFETLEMSLDADFFALGIRRRM